MKINYNERDYEIRFDKNKNLFKDKDLNSGFKLENYTDKKAQNKSFYNNNYNKRKIDDDFKKENNNYNINYNYKFVLILLKVNFIFSPHLGHMNSSSSFVYTNTFISFLSFTRSLKLERKFN